MSDRVRGDEVEVLAGDVGQPPGVEQQQTQELEDITQDVAQEVMENPEDMDEPPVEEHAAEDAEDVEPTRRPPEVYQPTAKELEDHRVDHLPYRNWCPWCVRGKANGQLHRRACKHHLMSVIFMDYFYITAEGGVMKRDELPYSQDDAGRASLESDVAEGKLVKLLMVKDGNTQCSFAYVVPRKGIDSDGFSVSRVVNTVLWLGHSRVILRGDNEPALIALIATSLKVLKVQLEGASEEHSQIYDSKSNGVVENAIKIFRGQFRTMKSDLEDRLGKKLPNEHPLVSWLAEHVTTLLNIRSRGQDGLTPWTRARGRPYSQTTYCFGESVFYKLHTKGPECDERGNMASRQGEGVYLGTRLSSSEYVIGTADGIRYSRSVTRKPEADRWKAEALSAVTATPWTLHLKPDPTVSFDQPVVRERLPEDRLPALPRNLKITFDDTNRFGYTDLCPQCDWMRVHGERRPGYSHSDTCRARILAELSKTPTGQQRLQQAEDRVNKVLARRLEAEVQGETPATADSGLEIDSTPVGVRGAMGVPVDESQPDETPEDSTTAQAGSQTGVDPGMDVDLLDEESNRFDPIMSMMITQLGGCGRSYQREKRKAVRNMVSEIWSPPRITQLLSKLPTCALVPGFALDLTVDDENGEAWDFDRKYQRDRVMARVRRERPKFLVLSPMCKAFSSWQNLNRINRDPSLIRAERMRAMIHLRFAMELAREQMDGGRYFVFEHLAAATSWKERCVRSVADLPDVSKIMATFSQLRPGGGKAEQRSHFAQLRP